MEQRVTYRNRRGQKLVGVFYRPAKYKARAAVLICHGFNDRKERDFLQRIGKESVRRGLAALSFDFSGQGKSEGRFDQITYTRYLQDIAASLAFLYRQGIQRVGMVGHGMGGALAALTARRDSRIAALVGLAPVARIIETHTRRWRDQYKAGQAKYLFLRDIREPKRTIKIGRGFLLDAKRYNLIRDARRITQPSLLIIGNKDTRVYTHEVRTLYRSLGSDRKKLVRIQNCDHLFSGRENKIVELTVGWLARHLATRLFIDTTVQNVLSLALLKSGRVVTFKKTIAFDQRDTLLRTIAGFLARRKINLAELGAVVVIRGPGPFTALRVGLTVANTLGLALKIPLLGVRRKEDQKFTSANHPLLVSDATALDFVRPWYDKKPNITKPKHRARHG